MERDIFYDEPPKHKAAAPQSDEAARKMIASLIAGGLLAAHGIDAGGATPEMIAHKALSIADAISDAVDNPPKQDQDGDDIPVKE